MIKPGFGQGSGFPRQGLGGLSRCRCPSCGYTENHRRDVPCRRIRCPNCSSRMVGD